MDESLWKTLFLEFTFSGFRQRTLSTAATFNTNLLRNSFNATKFFQFVLFARCFCVFETRIHFHSKSPKVYFLVSKVPTIAFHVQFGVDSESVLAVWPVRSSGELPIAWPADNRMGNRNREFAISFNWNAPLLFVRNKSINCMHWNRGLLGSSRCVCVGVVLYVGVGERMSVFFFSLFIFIPPKHLPASSEFNSLACCMAQCTREEHCFCHFKQQILFHLSNFHWILKAFCI